MTLFRRAAILGTTLGIALAAAPAGAQIKAQLPKGAMTPAWDKGIQPISRESYWNAVECGKQGGQRPLCVFYDADLCKNEDFTLALYTPYKQVAYEVWQAVKQKQEPPTPSYGDAQRTRITLGVTPAAGGKNAITAVTIKRGARAVKPATQSLDGGGGRFIFDYPAFAPTEDITIELAGRTRTQTCLVDKAICRSFASGLGESGIEESSNRGIDWGLTGHRSQSANQSPDYPIPRLPDSRLAFTWPVVQTPRPQHPVR